MNRKSLNVLLVIMACANSVLATYTEQKTVIVTEIPADNKYAYFDFYKDRHKDFRDSLALSIYAFSAVDLEMRESTVKEKVENSRVKWVVNIKEPLLIRLPFLKEGIYINPGDSLHIDFVNNEPVITGKGVETFQLQYAIGQHENEVPKPLSIYIDVNSLTDYLNWHKYLDEQLSFDIRLIESYKEKIPQKIYELIKYNTVKNIEFQRSEGFVNLYNVKLKGGDAGLSVKDMTIVADSTLNKPWAKWLRSQYNFVNNNETWYFYQYARIQVWNKVKWDFESNIFNTRSKKNRLYWDEVLKLYNGLLREQLMQYMLADQIIRKTGYRHPFTKMMLRAYYNEPGFPEYKQWMRDFEKTAAVKYNSQNEDDVWPLDFKLVDSQGKYFTSTQLKNKISLLYFAETDCKKCVAMEKGLQAVQEAFKGNDKVVFVNINTGPNKSGWLKSIQKRKSDQVVNVSTGGTGNGIFNDYGIVSYPDLAILDMNGTISEHPVPNPGLDNGSKLIDLISKKLVQLNDGPYVIYKGDTAQINYINTCTPYIEKRLQKEQIILTVNTDQYGKTFKVPIKKEMKNEPVEYVQPEKLLVLSDIEGNFDALRKLLQASGVIDDNYNWTFGNGHLVCIGDFFDRGEQVTEVLWLIYYLEEKAQKTGGYVHFILGNHELLNLCNDQRYLREKYKHNADVLGISYRDLFKDDSELGRWLRTKNIIEKIGNALYMHGGFSREANQLQWTLEEINDNIRPHLDNRDEFKQNNSTPELRTLFSSSTSPFWYRGYYMGKNQQGIIDSTLQKFKVAHIVTGHTIVTDTISVHYGRKVIDTDVHHAEGKSEALFINRNKYYRVGVDGIVKELFEDDNK